jgi:glutamate/tyrosine decarboxylase-like PLP-dependent enzyme
MTENRLFPAFEDRLRVDNGLTRLLADAHSRVVKGSVVPTFDVTRFRDQLAAFDFQLPCPLDDALAWTVEQLEHGVVHITHPRYFGLFNPTPTFPAQCADRIAAVFNPQLATRTTSPAAVEIEAHTVQAVAARIGLPPEARGHFTTGGTEANYTSVILALTRRCPRFAEDGARAFAGPPVFYVSTDSHLAWLKIAHEAGIGRSAVHMIATDGAGRMDLAALAEAIRLDRAAGREPFMIAATAGTTNAGMIDPLRGCAEIAREYDLWYHVDAAWGGALIAADPLRERLDGIERADSVTIDAHKWFATTMGCGIFITSWPALLSTAFHVSASYMPSNTANVDPYVTSVQWSRRLLGLRLFLSLAAVGWEGYGRHVEHTLAMSALFSKQIRALGWTIVNASPVGVVCVVPSKPVGIREIVDHVLGSGQAWVSLAHFEGREVIRACVTSGLTTAKDVSVLVSALIDAANATHRRTDFSTGDDSWTR